MLYNKPAGKSKCGDAASDDPESNLTGATVKQEFSIEYSRSLNDVPPGAGLSTEVYFGGILDEPPILEVDPEPQAKKLTRKIRGNNREGTSYKYVFSEPEVIGPS